MVTLPLLEDYKDLLQESEHIFVGSTLQVKVNGIPGYTI